MEYENWLKAVHGLFILRDAIAPVIDQEVKTFHQTLPGAVCGSCTYKDIAYDKTATFAWKIKKCGLCDSWLEKITEQHNQHTNKQLKRCWENTDVGCWSTKFWEVGKCYMPRGHTKDERSASDSDCAGLLTMITNCKFLQKSTILGRGADKVIAKRNNIFHAKAMSLDQLLTDQYLDAFIDYVNRMTVPDALKGDVLNNKQKLKQLRDGHLCLPGKETMKIEIDAITKRVDVLFENFEGFNPEQVMIALEETSRFIKQNENLTESFKEELERVDKRIAELGLRVTEMEHQQNVTQSHMENQLEGVQGKLTDVERQQNLTQNTLEGMGGRVDDIEHKQEELEGVMGRVTKIEHKQHQTQNQMEVVGDTISDMERLPGIIQSQMEEMDSQLEGMEDRVTGMEQQHDISHNQLEGVGYRVTSIEQQQDLTQNQLEGVKDKVNDIKQQLTLSMTSQFSETESSVEDTLSKNIGTCGSVSDLTVSSACSTSFYLKSDDTHEYLKMGVAAIDIQKADDPEDEKFDAVLIYAEVDRDDALKLRDIICRFITFSDGSKPRICVLDGLDLPHIQSRFEHMEVATEQSNYMLLYITEEGVKSKWFNIQKDESLMECIEIKKKQNCLIPLHTQPKSKVDYRYPYGTRSLIGIEIFQIVKGKTLSEVDPNTLTQKNLNINCLDVISAYLNRKR